eukprot:TRINITY_DN3961_c0_g1_i2.p1 TRINITY_DN3961_c0_g1~~TRINITY_DN3961_c0_g1_i2.p1  ORF type:complete len:228 (+),score=31.63 TRINITY_DN3961_c0_g1_i2:63-746(+)
MKLIFLDIDGVLVTRRLATFEEPLLRNLKRVVDQTGAEIVLSSDWRRHPAARAEAARVLATVGLNFISCTPCLSIYIAQRPTEIVQWQRDFGRRADPSQKITHWVAIDDRALLEERHGSYLKDHFVQTQPMRGLMEDRCEEVVRILNREAKPSDGTITLSEPTELGNTLRRGTPTTGGGHAAMQQSRRSSQPPPKGQAPAGVSTGGNITGTHGLRPRGRSMTAAHGR